MSLCGVATSNCPNKTRKQCSGSRHRRNGVNATSHRTSRIINAANGSNIVGYARAENGTSGRQHKGSWSIGRFRSGMPEGVCDKAVASPGPGDGADTVGAQRVRCRGDVEVRELAQSPVPTPTDYCSYCRAVVRRGGRSEECSPTCSIGDKSALP